MAYYPFSAPFNSAVIGGSWSTPFGTRFFIRCGDRSFKVPMGALRGEYEAWEKLRRERHPDPEPKPEPQPEPTEPTTLLYSSSASFDWADDVEEELFSSPSGSDSDSDDSTDDPAKPPTLLYPSSGTFDWADDVEQEFFSSPIGSDSDSDSTDDTDYDSDFDFDSEPDADLVDSPIVDRLVFEGVGAVGTGTTLCTILEEDEEEDVTGEDEAGDLDWLDVSDWGSSWVDDWPDSDATWTADSDTTILGDSDSTFLDDSTPPQLDDLAPSTASDTSNTSTDDPLLSTSSLFNLNTYTTIFNPSARLARLSGLLILLATGRW